MEVLSRILLLLTALLLGCCTGVQAAVDSSSKGPTKKCTFPDGAVGRCEEIKTCLQDGGVVRREETIVRCNAPPAGGIYVCCRRPKLIAQEMCDAWSLYWTEVTGFGNRSCTVKHSLIRGGENAEWGEFPNMAAVGVGKGPNNVNWGCGGSLITPLFVLTAAHCFKKLPTNVFRWVGLGEHDLTTKSILKLPRLYRDLPDGLLGIGKIRSSTNEAMVPVEQIIQIEKTFSYPDYQKNYHDIALMQLKTPAILTGRVLPSCLPFVGLKKHSDKPRFTVAGWGVTNFGSREGSKRVLQKVTITSIDPNLCWHQIFADLPKYIQPPLGITSDMICAGDKGKETCQGDSGGPLMVEPDTVEDGFCKPRVVAGVVSFGIGCKDRGLYTRTSSYLDWITGIVAPQLLPAAVLSA